MTSSWSAILPASVCVASGRSTDTRRQIVCRVFDAYAGKSPRRIAFDLNARACPDPTASPGARPPSTAPRARHRHPQQRVLYRSVGLDCAGAVYGRRLFCDDRAGAEANLLSPLLACCCLADCGGTAGGMLIGSASQGPLPGTDRGRRAKATQPPPATLNSATGCPPSPWNRDNRKTVGFRALPLGQVCARGSRPHGDWHADLASRGTQSCGQLFRECYRML